jgi:signal transduction histidine kinase
VRIVTREEKVLISVSDDGEGMDERERRTLFEKFASGRPDGGGTGLGMVISRQIVAMHGGRLMVDSVAGGGTTMMVSLPSRSDPWAPDETHARERTDG